MLTDEQLAAIKARLEAAQEPATEDPQRDHEAWLKGVSRRLAAKQQFQEAAPADVRTLLAEIERLRSDKEAHAQKGYSDTDIVGHHVKAVWEGYVPQEQVLCSDCWEKMSDRDDPSYEVVLDITFADTAEHELVCGVCLLQLPTRGEP